jgi:hypothetical protein
MAEIELREIKTQEALVAYLDEQVQAGADQQPYFPYIRRKVEEATEHGGLAQGLRKEAGEQLVHVLGIIAQAAANGRLANADFGRKISINGVNSNTNPEIATETWLNFWFVPGMTYHKLGSDLQDRLPKGIALQTASQEHLKRQATAIAAKADELLAQALGRNTTEFESQDLHPARGSKMAQSRILAKGRSL